MIAVACAVVGRQEGPTYDTWAGSWAEHLLNAPDKLDIYLAECAERRIWELSTAEWRWYFMRAHQLTSESFWSSPTRFVQHLMDVWILELERRDSTLSDWGFEESLHLSLDDENTGVAVGFIAEHLKGNPQLVEPWLDRVARSIEVATHPNGPLYRYESIRDAMHLQSICDERADFESDPVQHVIVNLIIIESLENDL